MEKIRLKNLPSSLKWAISAYFLLASIGFIFAALMSHDRYDFDHQKTIQYYLGDPADGEAAFKKPLSHLLGVTHVHAFMLPLVFLTLWIALQGVPVRTGFKKLIVFGGALSILIYNAAPYLVRFVSADYVFLFTVGGIGLFLFFLGPSGIILREIWTGKQKENHHDI